MKDDWFDSSFIVHPSSFWKKWRGRDYRRVPLSDDE
jgi:hypothetical protein